MFHLFFREVISPFPLSSSPSSLLPLLPLPHPTFPLKLKLRIHLYNAHPNATPSSPSSWTPRKPELSPFEARRVRLSSTRERLGQVELSYVV